MSKEYWADICPVDSGKYKTYFQADLYPENPGYADVLHLKEVTPGEKSFTRDEIQSAMFNAIRNDRREHWNTIVETTLNELFGAGGDV